MPSSHETHLTVKDRHEAAIVASGQVVVDWDAAADVVVYGGDVEGLLGYTAAELTGDRAAFDHLIHPEDLARVNHEVARDRPAAVRFCREYRVIRKDERLIHVAVDGRYVRDDARRLVRCIGLMRDVTATRLACDQRDALLEAERSARAESERASRVKDELLAMVSHDLRTPVHAILGWATMLREGRLTPTATERALEVIERNARAQRRLIDDILDGTRVATGKLDLVWASMSLTETVDAALGDVRQLGEPKGLRFVVDLPAGAVVTRGDAARLQQVVWNLVSNAVKFSEPHGTVWVALAARGERATLTVRDGGRGIAPDLLPFVFERFRQAKGADARRQSGLGLGLAIVRHIVELHGGAVRAESEGEGLGATFVVDLPLHPPDDDARPSSPSAVPDLTGLRVVVVDDDPDARDLAVRVLGGAGARVRTATTASEAHAAIQETSADALLADLSMPGEDGFQLVRALRAAGRRLRAVALTGFSRAEDRERAFEAGFDAWVGKPIDPRLLLLALAPRRGG